MSDPAGDGWHLDKRIPVALIMALLAQAVAFGYAWAEMSSRIAVLEQQQDRTYPNSARLTTLEVQIKGLQRTLDRVEEKLDRRADK